MRIFPPDLRYTLCFLIRAEQVLLLHRRRPPNQGLWNGVGGHIEPGEDPRAACLREIREETGYRVEQVRFAGLLTWTGFETGSGGLYLFTAEAPAEEPQECEEGRLAWFSQADLFRSPEVVSNIHIFGPVVLSGEPAGWHHFDYQGGEIKAYQLRPLPPTFYKI